MVWKVAVKVTNAIDVALAPEQALGSSQWKRGNREGVLAKCGPFVHIPGFGVG